MQFNANYKMQFQCKYKMQFQCKYKMQFQYFKLDSNSSYTNHQ